jgi:hypothetical protein
MMSQGNEYESWPVSERYLRGLYGDRVADRYVELRGEHTRAGDAQAVGQVAITARVGVATRSSGRRP